MKNEELIMPNYHNFLWNIWQEIQILKKQPRLFKVVKSDNQNHNAINLLAYVTQTNISQNAPNVSIPFHNTGFVNTPNNIGEYYNHVGQTTFLDKPIPDNDFFNHRFLSGDGGDAIMSFIANSYTANMQMPAQIQLRQFPINFSQPSNFYPQFRLHLKSKFPHLAVLLSVDTHHQLNQAIDNLKCHHIKINPEIESFLSWTKNFVHQFNMSFSAITSEQETTIQSQAVYEKKWLEQLAEEWNKNLAMHFLDKSSTSVFKMQTRQFIRTPEQRLEIVCDYVKAMYRRTGFIDCYEVKIWTKIQQSAQQSILNTKNWKFDILKKTRETFNKKLQNHRLFKQVKGYFWSLEYDLDKGFYYQYYFFFNKTQENPEFKFQGLLHGTDLDYLSIESKILCGVAGTANATFWILPEATQKKEIIGYKKKLLETIKNLYQPKIAAYPSNKDYQDKCCKKFFFGKKELN